MAKPEGFGPKALLRNYGPKAKGKGKEKEKEKRKEKRKRKRNSANRPHYSVDNGSQRHVLSAAREPYRANDEVTYN